MNKKKVLPALEQRIFKIAENYASLIEKRLLEALKETEEASTAMLEINDGIRMLNHVAATLEKISRLSQDNDKAACNQD